MDLQGTCCPMCHLASRHLGHLYATVQSRQGSKQGYLHSGILSLPNGAIGDFQTAWKTLVFCGFYAFHHIITVLIPRTAHNLKTVGEIRSFLPWN